MKYCTILSFFFLLTFFQSFSQRRDVKVLSSAKRHELAEKLIKQGGYYAAIDHMKDLVQKHPENEIYAFKLAEAYFHSRDYQNAEIWYEKLAETKDLKKKKKSILTLATFHYGEALKYNGKYDQAREVFQLFANGSYKELKGEKYKAWAKNEVLSCEFALTNQDRLRYVEILNLDSNVNSGYSDFAPRMRDDTTLVYSSIQEDSVISVRHGEKHFEHTKIYASDFQDSTWQAPSEVEQVNSIFEHSGNGTFSPDGKRFYFSRCRPIKGQMRCQIYSSKVTEEGLSKPKKLEGSVNHSSHTCTQPFSAKIKSGKTEQEILLFVSDMKGTTGGLDIWYAPIDANGKAGKVTNCGKNVNSTRDEVSPFYDSENGVLYFSSNYHNGFGGHDIFASKGGLNKLSKPENLLKPVNSNLDDTYYTLNKSDNHKGFLVSNRPGGMALLSATCCDDIYSFQAKQPTILVINVVDSLTGAVVNNARVSVKSSRYVVGTPDSLILNTDPEVMDSVELQNDKANLENLRLAQNPKEYYILESSSIAQIVTEAPTYSNSRIVIKTDKAGIVDSMQVFEGAYRKEGSPKYVTLNVVMAKERFRADTAQGQKKDTVHVASSLKKEFEKLKEQEALTKNVKEQTNLNNVDSTTRASTKAPATETKLVSIEFALNLHFQYDKAEIVSWDQVKLDSLVTILTAHPNIKMEFTTHTDWIGSDEYNWKLSYRRASFISNYIISKGISRKRVIGRGLGETKHIAPNAHPDGSDDPDGRQMNRRTDIKLISGS